MTIDEVERLKELEASLEVLAHLAGFASALKERAIENLLTAIAVSAIAERADMSTAEVLKQAAADARASAEASDAASKKVASSINSALARLSDNATLTADDVAAITTDLNAAKAANDEGAAAANTASGVADTIDPEIPGGVVATGDGGVSETPPPA